MSLRSDLDCAYSIAMSGNKLLLRCVYGGMNPCEKGIKGLSAYSQILAAVCADSWLSTHESQLSSIQYCFNVYTKRSSTLRKLLRDPQSSHSPHCTQTLETHHQVGEILHV